MYRRTGPWEKQLTKIWILLYGFYIQRKDENLYFDIISYNYILYYKYIHTQYMKKLGEKDSRLTTGINATVQKQLIEKPPFIHGLILKAIGIIKSSISDLVSEMELREVEKKLQHVLNNSNEFITRYPHHKDMVYKISLYWDMYHLLDEKDGQYKIRGEEISSEFIQDVISF